MRTFTAAAVEIRCLVLSCLLAGTIGSARAEDVKKRDRAEQDAAEAKAAQVRGGQARADEARIEEDRLCQKLEDCYKSIQSVEKEKGKISDIHVERLSYLVLVAGSHSAGSRRLDAILGRIQKESPTLVVPRFVVTSAELGQFVRDMAADDANDLAYSAYLRKVRAMSQWIQQAKHAITARSGFQFEPAPVVVSQ